MNHKSRLPILILQMISAQLLIASGIVATVATGMAIAERTHRAK